MKMKTFHYNIIKAAMEKVINNYPAPGIKAAYKASGLSDKRFRWDILYRAMQMFGIRIGHSHNNDMPLYDYLDDSHIDTALRRITSTK